MCLSVCLYLKLCHNHPANCDINIVICCLAKMANNFLESSFCPHCLPPMAQSIFILSFGIFARYKYFVKCGLDITTLSAVVRNRTASKETKLFQVKNTNIVNFLKKQKLIKKMVSILPGSITNKFFSNIEIFHKVRVSKSCIS